VRFILPISFISFILAACTFISAEEKGIQLSMDSTAYDVNSMGVLLVQNYTKQPLYLRGCTTVFPLYTVQKRRDDGSYEDVYRITCSPRPPAPRKIDVESAIQSNLRIRFDVGRGGITTGTYRILMSLHRDAAATTPALDTLHSVTKPFFVR
jgi:hypothetical protein